jgi:tetratricopeptide (TPR) repeat protein
MTTPSDQTFERAEWLFQRGQYSDAANLLQVHLQLQPDSARALILLGRTLNLLGQRAAAAAAIAQGIAIDPADEHSYLGKALFLLETKAYGAMVETLDQVIQLRPNWAIAFAMRAFALRCAADEWDRQRQVNPGPTSLSTLLFPQGQTLRLRGMQDVTTALALESELPLAHEARVALLAKLDGRFGYPQVGESAWQKWDEGWDYSLIYGLELGIWGLQRRRRRRVQPDRRVESLSDHIQPCSTQLALMREKQQYRQQLLPAVLEFLRLKPNDADAHALYGKFLMAQGRYGEAVAELRIALQFDPSHTGAESALFRAISYQMWPYRLFSFRTGWGQRVLLIPLIAVMLGLLVGAISHWGGDNHPAIAQGQGAWMKVSLWGLATGLSLASLAPMVATLHLRWNPQAKHLLIGQQNPEYRVSILFLATYGIAFIVFALACWAGLFEWQILTLLAITLPIGAIAIGWLMAGIETD